MRRRSLLGRMESTLLSYEEALKRVDAPPGSSWGLFGPEDELGTLNFLTPDRVSAAAGLIRSGAVFNLDLSADAFDPPITHRSPPKHTIFSHAPYHRDDFIDGYYLQGSSQIDSLRHFKHPGYGFYNGVADAEINSTSPSLGINRMAERGIVGRGVLLDLVAYFESVDRRVDYVAPTAFTVADLEGAAHFQGVRIEPGDILLLRTGWLTYLRDSAIAVRRRLQDEPVSPGLEQTHGLVRWIWDNQIALLAADNLGVEVMPPVATSPFRDDPLLAELQGRHVGMVHPVLIGLLGLPLGELWSLDELAGACRGDGRWEFFISAHPLNIRGGVGSPPNALAIK